MPSAGATGRARYRRRWPRGATGCGTRLLAACRPGAPASDLLDGYTGAGEPLPPMPVARGLGLGFDPPVVTGGLPRTARDERIEAGMVLALTGYVWEAGTGAAFRRDTVLVTSDGPELLTSAPGVPIG